VPVLNAQWITPDDGQRNCPKHVECRTRINLEISASCFIVKKFITMHGHMNVKLVQKYLCCGPWNMLGHILSLVFMFPVILYKIIFVCNLKFVSLLHSLD
jgi:hypothetical protein